MIARNVESGQGKKKIIYFDELFIIKEHNLCQKTEENVKVRVNNEEYEINRSFGGIKSSKNVKVRVKSVGN